MNRVIKNVMLVLIVLWFIMAFLLLFSDKSVAGELWTDDAATNSTMIAANAMMVIDWGQTRTIAQARTDDGGRRYKEEGFAENFIGEYPDVSEVDRYFVRSMILTNAVAYVMPRNFKKNFYLAVLVYEGHYVQSNYSIGIGTSF